MVRPSQDAIETFKAITGTSDDVALSKLEVHRGDLNAAINAHFSESDRVNIEDQSLSNIQDFMDIDDQAAVDPEVQHYPLFPASRTTNPFSPLDPVIPPHSFDTRRTRNNGAPRTTHPRYVSEIPIDFKDGSSQSRQLIPTIEDVTEHGSTVQGMVIIDDEEDVSLVPPPARNLGDNDQYHYSPAPSAPHINEAIDIDDDIEEQMIRAAIEASKQEASTSQENKFNPADAVSLSVKSVDERLIHDTTVEYGKSKPSTSSGNRIAHMDHVHEANGRFTSDEGDDAEDSEEQPLMRRRSSRRHGSSTVDEHTVDISSSGDYGNNRPQLNGDIFSVEWGGISSEECDEAMMLEAAMFGPVPESSANPFARPLHSLSERHDAFHTQIARSPSPTLLAQRILREQQDDEYLASLAADREKEQKANQEAEFRHLEEVAEKAAALEQERRQKEAAVRKLREEEEYEEQIAAKQASLPQEPSVDDENAVTLLIRMPDGNRQGRRFLKSDKLQSLFDFIDVGKVVKPSTYRLVRPYPRRSYGEADKEQSLSELGLTSKQEALFLESL